MPYRVRVRAAAAAGTAAAAWGAVVGPPSRALIAKLRTAAGRAVWRGGRYGAVEVRLLLGGPDGRADPAASFALQPLVMLTKALRWGIVQGTEVADIETRAANSPVGRGIAAGLTPAAM